MKKRTKEDLARERARLQFAWLDQIYGDPGVDRTGFKLVYGIAKWIDHQEFEASGRLVAWRPHAILAHELGISIRTVGRQLAAIENRGHMEGQRIPNKATRYTLIVKKRSEGDQPSPSGRDMGVVSGDDMGVASNASGDDTGVVSNPPADDAGGDMGVGSGGDMGVGSTPTWVSPESYTSPYTHPYTEQEQQEQQGSSQTPEPSRPAREADRESAAGSFQKDEEEIDMQSKTPPPTRNADSAQDSSDRADELDQAYERGRADRVDRFKRRAFPPAYKIDEQNDSTEEADRKAALLTAWQQGWDDEDGELGPMIPGGRR